MMYHKPHVKSVKKIDKQIEQTKKNQSAKKIPSFVAKPAPNMTKAPRIPVQNRQGGPTTK